MWMEKNGIKAGEPDVYGLGAAGRRAPDHPFLSDARFEDWRIAVRARADGFAGIWLWEKKKAFYFVADIL